MKVSNGVHFTRFWVTIAMKWCYSQIWLSHLNCFLFSFSVLRILQASKGGWMFWIRAWVLGCSEKSKMVIIVNTPAVRLGRKLTSQKKLLENVMSNHTVIANEIIAKITFHFLLWSSAIHMFDLSFPHTSVYLKNTPKPLT